MHLPGGGGGGFTLLANETVSAASALDFTGLDDRPMVLEFSGVYSSAANQYLHVRYSLDGGLSFVTTGGSFSDTAGTDGATTSNGNQIPLTGNIFGAGSQFEAGGFFFLSGFGTPERPTITGRSYYGRGSNVPYGLDVSGRFVDGDPVDAIRLAMSSGNLTGTFRLWRLNA